MRQATMWLIEAVERLNMSGEIGDGMVATLHELAGLARLEQNPFDTGSAERVLYDRHRRADAAARKAERERDLAAADADAHRAAANKFADALRALGHGDKVPGQVALPAPQTHGG